MTAALLCALMLMATASARAGQTILYYLSEPDEYIGQGEEVTFTPTDGAFSVYPSFANGITVRFQTPTLSHWWYLNLVAPNGAVLQPGSYPAAERWPFQSAGHPGLDFSGDGRGCNTLTGTFNVLELVRDAGNSIVQLAVDWEQHCEGLQPALFGQLRFNSNVPLSAKPIHIHLQNPVNVQGCVEAANPNGAQVTVDGLGIVDSQGGTALGYAWSTSTGKTGSGGSFTFAAPLTQGQVAPVVVTLTVTDLTNGGRMTVTKAICVSDTTPPVIVIHKPKPGEFVRDNIALDVSISDAVDKTIDEYEVVVGRSFVSAIDPRTGRSRTNLFNGAKPDGTITNTITVRVYDASGNVAERSVTVTQVKK